MSLRFAALGLDHRHIFGMAQGMIDAGCDFAGYWTLGRPHPYAGFKKRFPDVPEKTLDAILHDPDIPLVLIATAPADRADLALMAMSAGKDVMLDKPGCLTVAELDRIEAKIAQTGRIWSVDFSERFEVPSTTLAKQLLDEGRIGKLIHILSQCPHRLNAHMRPDWFWTPPEYGGILGDIGTHQIDQFLHFSQSDSAQITFATVDNLATPDHPDFQDFGEMNLMAGDVRGYVRLDWFTPDAAPNWGDGRLTLVGTEGYIELRKYMDVAGQPGTDHVFLVNGDTCTRFDAREAGTPYFANLRDDVLNRTEKACPQRHTLTVTRLAFEAQAMADTKRTQTGLGRKQ
ncbi:oxidoreductase [Actibacterium mucosum KCTC 23349]|uniref:Oxidoreductase n=1 Tax=Actibacterium mucosum KCTC 23349 TaxID=1454373 RepID=A0A037ZID7_9RHOB|nr:Gfo/Idh/MocA family oxidoreductase [Actibacterium mucosum]KAJ55863.1 oxidoreductase [Actibacterium mucosum KCTC 23349]